MQLVFDPPIPVKIEKMKQRLRWKDPIAAQKGIDRTRLVIDDGKSDRPEFSFLAIGDTGTGEQKYNAQRRFLQQKLDLLETEKFKLLQTVDLLESEDTEQLRDLPHKLEQIEEMTLDIRKQLEMRGEPPIDVEQLNWLEQRLLHSWNTPEVRGRIVFFHHPPYVTEATKWNLSQTIAVRHHLQRVFDRVANQLGKDRGNRSIVDLVLNGHAHCLEYIRTFDTGHADSYSNWIVCGGSGYSLRRQRPEGSDLMRKIESDSERETELMARSQLFVGRNGYGSKKRRPYSFARIDVRAGTPPRFVFRPFTIERFQHQWHYNEVKSFNF
jgi:hypothetical protein